MIQLKILSGKQAGSEIVVRRFPFVIGRGAADFPLDDAGVWERHLQIDFQRGQGFNFIANPDALVIINGENVSNGLLRNGDAVELGSVSLRAWLARSEQKALRWRENVTWAGLFLLFAAQGALIVFLLR